MRVSVVAWLRAKPATASSRRGNRQARSAILFGGVVFGLLSFALALAAETVKPQWRDPEYGHRLKQLRRWHLERPHRPLVLVFGSSRAQMGVSPAAMNFPDESGSPLVYNFGYRAATPVFVLLQLERLLDAGIRPRAVVVMIALLELSAGSRGEVKAAPWWSGRFSESDLRRLAPYAAEPENADRTRFSARCGPWSARNAAILSDLLPEWQLYSTRLRQHFAWESMDRHGFVTFPLLPWAEEARRTAVEQNWNHAAWLNEDPVSEPTRRAHRELVRRCREEGIAVAFCWAPDAPSYQAMYTSTGRAIRTAYEEQLRVALGVPVFAAPEHFEEDDFADGLHLLPAGAAKYSRWLADTHLKPWLTQVLP